MELVENGYGVTYPYIHKGISYPKIKKHETPAKPRLNFKNSITTCLQKRRFVIQNWLSIFRQNHGHISKVNLDTPHLSQAFSLVKQTQNYILVYYTYKLPLRNEKVFQQREARLLKKHKLEEAKPRKLRPIRSPTCPPA